MLISIPNNYMLSQLHLSHRPVDVSLVILPLLSSVGSEESITYQPFRLIGLYLLNLEILYFKEYWYVSHLIFFSTSR